MLVIDGVKYKLWTPTNEEKEFHPMVRKNSKVIFGETTVYFDIKTLLKSPSGIGSIPDAYVISLTKPSEWYVIENELSSHSIYDHVIRQLTKFINGLENQGARSQIIDLIYQAINDDSVLKAKVKKLIDSEDIYHFLSKLISTSPRIVIVINEKTPELEEATKVLNYHTDIVEFKTYVRENADTVQAYLFEPLHSSVGFTSSNPPPKSGEVTSQPAYTIPLLESLAELGGSGKMSDVLDKVQIKMKDKLKPKDYELLTGGAIRWRNQVQWQRNNLKDEGYIKKDSPRGIWEITDEGRKYCENQKSTR